MKNLVLVLVLLVSGIGFSQTNHKGYSEVTVLPTITKKERDSLKKIAAQPIDLKKVEDELVDMINDYRVENGLQPLQRHSLLDSAAHFQSSYMAESGDVTHYNPSVNMENSDRRVTKYMGKTSKYIVENASSKSIYFNVVRENKTVAESIFIGWKSSVDHNKILLYKDTNLVGVSITRNGDKVYSVFDSAKY